MEEGAPETSQASLQSEVVSHLLAPSQGTLSAPLFGEDQEPQRGDRTTVIRSHQGPRTHREDHRRVQIIGDREEDDVVRSRTVKRTKGEPVRARGHTQERAGSLALSTRSCSLACSTRARDPSVGKINRNQWAAKPGHYLTGTRCHWLAPALVRAVAMTVWTGVAQRCQKEAPLFSPGIPIQLQGPLLGPQEKNRAPAAPAGTRTPLTTPVTSLPQPLPSFRCLAPPCYYTSTCRQPDTYNHAGQRWPLRRQMSPSKSVPWKPCPG